MRKLLLTCALAAVTLAPAASASFTTVPTGTHWLRDAAPAYGAWWVQQVAMTLIMFAF